MINCAPGNKQRGRSQQGELHLQADGPGVGSSSAGNRIPMWLHPAGQAPAAHIPHPSWGAQSSAPGTAATGPLLLTVADPFPGTDVPSSHEGGLGNRILEADPSLFQGIKIHQSPTVATLDVDSSAQDTGETKSHQEPAATEEPKAHSGNEELQICCPISWGRFAALCGVWWHQDVPHSASWAVPGADG